MRITKIAKDTFIIAWIKSYPDFRRNPLQLTLIFMVSGVPLFFMLMSSSGSNTLANGLVGAMISSVAFIGVSAGVQDISWDRYVKIREMIVAMPVHPVSYALGVALAPLLFSIPSLVFYGILLAYLGFFTATTVAWIVPALIIVWAATSSMGFMISTYLFKASWMVLNNLGTLLGIGFVFVPPVYYSEAQLGNWSWLSVVIPTSNAAGLIRSDVGLLPMSMETTILRWAVLIMTTVVFITLTFAKAKWREK